MSNGTYDPRPFLRHQTLASLWCQYNGQRGTALQVSRVMRQLSHADLVRMLTERGVVLPEDGESPAQQRAREDAVVTEAQRYV